MLAGHTARASFARAAQLLHLAGAFKFIARGRAGCGCTILPPRLHKFGASLDWDFLERRDGLSGRHIAARGSHARRATFGVSVPESADARLAGLRPTWHERLARVLAEPTAHQAAFSSTVWRRELATSRRVSWGVRCSRRQNLSACTVPFATAARWHGNICCAWGAGCIGFPALWAGMTQLSHAAR